MKKENLESTVVYRDLAYEQKTNQQLDNARRLMQSLMSEWSRLELGPCDEVNELLMFPERVYRRAVDQLLPDASSGPFRMKRDAQFNTLELPNPERLYSAAKTIRQQPLTTHPGLWLVTDGTVTVNEDIAVMLTDAMSIYTNTPEKIARAEKLTKFIELFNELNAELAGELLPPIPTTVVYARGKFNLDMTNPGLQTISLDPDNLRRWLDL